MADQDLTRPVDDPKPLQPPQRVDVKLLEVREESDDSPAQETFADPGRRLKLDKDEKVELANMLNDLLTDIKQQRTNLEVEANWDLWEDNYFGVTPEPSLGQQTQAHIPITQEVVDTIGSVMDRALYTAKPVFQIAPREQMDVDVAKRKEQHMDYVFTVEMEGQKRLAPVLFETRLLGTGVSHLPWLYETDRIVDEEEYDGLNVEDMKRFDDRYPKATEIMPEVVRKLRSKNPKTSKVRFMVEYTEAIHDAPDLTYVPVRKWIVRPLAKPHLLHREVFVGHEFDLRWDDLKRWEEEGYYDDIDPVRFGLNEKGEKFERPDFQTTIYPTVTGIVRWRRKGETRERRYLVDYDQPSRTILRILRYPYWHNKVNYIPHYLQQSTRYIYGISPAQKVETSQATANASRSLLLDILSYSVPMFIARKGTENMFNPLRDGMYAGKTWFMPNPQADVQTLQTGAPSTVSALLAVEAGETRHAELASGALQNVSGLESARDPDAPASKTALQLQQALMRIGTYISVLSGSMTELAYQIEELYYQFSPEGRIFRVTGGDEPTFPQITRQELRLRADYFPHISMASLNPDKEKQDNIEAIGILLKEPGIASSDLKRWAAWEIALDSLGSNWAQKKHKFLPSPQEMELFRKQEEVMLMARQKKIEQVLQKVQGGDLSAVEGSNVRPEGAGGPGAAGAGAGNGTAAGPVPSRTVPAGQGGAGVAR